MIQLNEIEKAFKDAGIGSVLSKFVLAQNGNRFTLGDHAGTESNFCIVAHLDGFPVRRNVVSAVTGRDSMDLHPVMEWRSNVGAAQKVIAKAVINKGQAAETLYYLDSVNQSILMVCADYTLEITPIVRVNTDIESHAVFEYLGFTDEHPSDAIKVEAFESAGTVLLIAAGQRYHTNYSVDEFNNRYGCN